LYSGTTLIAEAKKITNATKTPMTKQINKPCGITPPF
jgi:hypothetical protein